MSDNLKILKSNDRKYLSQIINCHKLVFPKSLQNAFGDEYLRKTFYWYLQNSTHRKIIIYKKNEKVVGFLTMKSTSDPDSFIKYIYRTILKSFFLRPYLFFNIELLGSIFFHLKNKKNQSNMHKTALELVSIGVLPQHAGIGIGKKLLKEFEKYAKENKIRKLKLSVLNSNEDGISFYLSNQWIKKPISSTKYIFFEKKIKFD
tara:strand:- start:18387 stop:18995 length:609 start_codon:yes stop_codon:yes gene_type:complete